MIPRYEVSDVAKIWSEESRYRYFLEVELSLLRVLEKKGIAPRGTLEAFDEVQVRPKRIQEIEETTRHDVIAFCTSVTEQVKPDAARFFHFGVTSSDILDTALTLQIRDSLLFVVSDLEKLIDALDKRVDETKNLISLGRSHGMAAEPMVFAAKFLSFRAELARRLIDYKSILENEMTGQLSGAVGNYTVIDPETEAQAISSLKLKVEEVSTQVIPRDRHAKVVSLGAMTATGLERLAVEIRHLHHTDIGEVHEGFKKGQKGSSTMPHKKNPISSENISGMARVLRSHASLAFENMVLWHERDISHSSAERLYLPDHFGLLVYSIRRMTSTILDLEIHREIIESKVTKNFATVSSLLLHHLILKNEVSREELYELVQSAAFEAKTLDEMLSLLEESTKRKKLQFDRRAFKLERLIQDYFHKFEAVLKRARV